jgi:hypothetical protein
MTVQQCCVSGMFISDPDFTHPGSKKATKICCHIFFCSYKFQNYFIFEMLKNKIWVNFQRIIELFTQKDCH